MLAPVLSVRDLVVEFDTERGPVRAVDGVSFDVMPEESLGLVGESGCGKTVTGLSVLRLVPSPPGHVRQGRIELGGRDLLALDEKTMQDVRGAEVSMIFQEPMTALNPVFTIGTQMTDVLRRHRRLTRRQAREAAAELLARVHIPAPRRRLDDYPHQMSGGMRQRVMIAMALSCNPRLLIADEPTTALDVTTQAEVLEEMRRLKEEFRMAVVLITHDLGVIAETCRRAVVMYCGSIIETGEVRDLFARPLHPYTAGLLRSVPQIRETPLPELPVIPGRVPDLHDLPRGCRFADRCERARARCRAERPALDAAAEALGGNLGADRRAACFYPL